jgi:chorismate mutase
MAIGSQSITSPERERQIIKRLIEQQFFWINKKSHSIKKPLLALKMGSTPQLNHLM